MHRKVIAVIVKVEIDVNNDDMPGKHGGTDEEHAEYLGALEEKIDDFVSNMDYTIVSSDESEVKVVRTSIDGHDVVI